MNGSIAKQIVFKEDLPPIDKYMLLFESTGWNEEYRLNPDEVMKSLSNSWYCITAYHDEKLVGSGRLVTDGIMHAMIYDMIVLPEYQGKGIGNEILNRLVEKCKQNRIRDVQLFCAKGKKEFYIKNGFVVRPEDAPGMQLRM